MIRIIDNALSSKVYGDLLCQIACGPFSDEVNKVDGVTYPLICKAIPESVTNEVSEIIGGEFVEFIRISPKDVHCPHPIHHDGSMGRASIMLYTSDIGGTGLFAHKRSGCMLAPQDRSIANELSVDSANIDEWEMIEVCEAKPNRMAIFDARLMHGALPFGGFGDGNSARTVYTRFVK